MQIGSLELIVLNFVIPQPPRGKDITHVKACIDIF